MVLIFFLLVSEQIFAHNNNSFFDDHAAVFEQEFFDEPVVTKEQTTAKTNIASLVSKQIPVNIQQISAYIVAFEQQHIVFQNNILLEKLSKNLQANEEQTEDDCNCLNDCSCLECQCANCPMASSCHGTSVILLQDIMSGIEPVHENLYLTKFSVFISQPHTLLFRPPIKA